MFSYVLAITLRQPARLVLTLLGVGLCTVLMLFLLGAYRGVANGSLDYIRKSHADLWVLHKNTNNILRGQSILPTSAGETIASLPGVKSVSPILMLLSTVETRDGWSSVYLVGYDPHAGIGGPPAIVQGHGIEADDQIVIDQAFAAKWNFKVGDTLSIQNTSLCVSGISSGTNAFVIQYAFVSLEQARRLLGFIPVVSCYLVRSDSSSDLREVSTQITSRVNDATVYTQEEFLANNAHELSVGFLPFIVTIVVIGTVVLVTLLSLLQSISILESRKDFATVKMIGAPNRFLPRLITFHALLVATAGAIVGFVLICPTLAVVNLYAPEVTIELSGIHCILVCAVVGFVSIFSALAPVRRLRGIYPLEAFR